MATRDLWHLGFARLVRQGAPPNFEVRPEVPLSDEPQRADLILIRRTDVPARDAEATVLRALWPHLAAFALVEFKSPVKGFRKTDLMRLMSYGAQYHVLEAERIDTPRDLTLVLVVPSSNPTLTAEIARMGLRLTLLGGGYGRIDGGVYTVLLVVTDEVSEQERDDFLRIFSHHDCETKEAYRWWAQWEAEGEEMQDPSNLEGREEIIRKFVSYLSLEERFMGLAPEQRLAGLMPEQRLAGLAPEQRLAGLMPEQQVLALSDEVLRGLSDDYLRSLPPDVQEAVRKRIGRPGA